jgi:hypothetical protein
VEELPNSSVVHKQNPYILFYKKTTPNVPQPQQQPEPQPKAQPAAGRGRGRGRGRGGGRGGSQQAQGGAPAKASSAPKEGEEGEKKVVEAGEEKEQKTAPTKGETKVQKQEPVAVKMLPCNFYLNMEDDERMEIVLKVQISPEVFFSTLTTASVLFSLTPSPALPSLFSFSFQDVKKTQVMISSSGKIEISTPAALMRV